MRVPGIIGAMLLTVFLLSAGISFGQDPYDVDYDRGLELGVQGKFEEARAEFEKALETDPLKRSVKESLKVAEDAIAGRIKRGAAVFLFKGAAASEKGLHDQALSDYSRAVAA